MNETSFQNWIHNSGFFQGAFPIEKANCITLFDKQHMRMSDDIVDVSDNFAFDFQNTGVMDSKGNFYTEKIVPIVENEFKIKHLLEKNVDEKYYLDQDNLEKWTYMKGSKNETRTTKDGYEYNYTEGAIPFPDSIEKSARTMLTSEGSKNRSTHVIMDPQTKRLRILTPKEAERINGFPDNWTNTGMPEKFRYFCMGNALVIGIIEKIGKQLSQIIDYENMSASKTMPLSKTVYTEYADLNEQISL